MMMSLMLAVNSLYYLGLAFFVKCCHPELVGGAMHNFYRSMLFSNGAVMPSHDVCLSVCLSVTLMDADHIR